MRGLWKKDAIIMKNQKTTIIIFVLIGLLNGYSNSIMFAFLFMELLVVSLVLMTITYDQENNGLIYLFALPIKKVTYVKEKYLLTIVALFIGIIVCLIEAILLAQMQLTINISFNILLISIMLSLIFGIGYMSIMLPLYLKFGVEKARMLGFITLFFLIFSFIGILNLDKLGINTGNLFSNLSIELIVCITIAVGILIFGISYNISKKIVNKL